MKKTEKYWKTIDVEKTNATRKLENIGTSSRSPRTGTKKRKVLDHFPI